MTRHEVILEELQTARLSVDNSFFRRMRQRTCRSRIRKGLHYEDWYRERCRCARDQYSHQGGKVRSRDGALGYA